MWSGSRNGVSVFCTEEGGEDCGHCLSLATSHKCGWCATIEVCTTFSQCKSNPFNTTTNQVTKGKMKVSYFTQNQVSVLLEAIMLIWNH